MQLCKKCGWLCAQPEGKHILLRKTTLLLTHQWAQLCNSSFTLPSAHLLVLSGLVPISSWSSWSVWILFGFGLIFGNWSSCTTSNLNGENMVIDIDNMTVSQSLSEFVFSFRRRKREGWLVLLESGALDSCPPITRKQSSLSALTWTCPESVVLTHFCPFDLPVTDTLISDTEVNIWITNLEHTSHTKVLIRQLVDNQHAKYLLLRAVFVLCVYNMLHNVQL